MPNGQNYPYDLFISYSSLDRPWAEKLNAALTQKGFNVFFDANRLEAGKPWEPQLLTSLKEARHVLVLWSNNAKASDWVTQETYRFAQIIDPTGSGQPVAGRRLFVLLLEGENTALGGYQIIRDLKEAGAYDSAAPDRGLGQLNPAVWQRVLDKIEPALKSDDASILIPLAVLTTTQARLAQEVNSAQKMPGGGASLDTLLGELNLGAKADLLQYYGATWRDWKPFHDNISLWTILDQTKDWINQLVKSQRFRWEPLGEDFYDLGNAPQEAVERQIDRLSPNASVIVVDPLALYDIEVKWRFDLMYRCFENPNTLILVLPPVNPPASNQHLRSLIKNLAKRVYDHFYEPPVFGGGKYARCGANVGDELDIRHWLLTTLGPHFAQAPSELHPVLQQGGN